MGPRCAAEGEDILPGSARGQRQRPQNPPSLITPPRPLQASYSEARHQAAMAEERARAERLRAMRDDALLQVSVCTCLRMDVRLCVRVGRTTRGPLGNGWRQS